MIHITGKWYVGGDASNVILYRKETAKKGKKTGEDYFKEECYPGDFRHALDILVEKRVRIALKQKQAMEELADAIDDIHKDIKEFCDKHEDRIKEAIEEMKATRRRK